MKSSFRRLLVLAGLSAVISCGALAQRPLGGAWKTAEPDDAEVVAAAEFAISAQGEKLEQPIALVSIENAEKQVVAGMKFRLCLKVEVDDEEQEVKVLVVRSLQKEFKLESWEEGSCDKPSGAHARNSTRNVRELALGGVLMPNHFEALRDPEATFVGARVVHNVTVKGKKGMRIHANFRVRYGLEVPCRMIAYFFDEDGAALDASDDAYTTQQGKVSASTRFTPQYDPATYSNLEIYIPYEALNLESGDTYTVKFYLALYDNEGQRFFGKSGWYNFRLTMPE